MTKQQPLRKPENSTPTTLSQYAEIKEIWKDFRDRVMSLKREDYMSQGKKLAIELQSCVQRNQRDINKVIHILYERSVKDLHSYPIAALLFEDLGTEAVGSFGGERILDELQKEIQKSLSNLNTKLGRMEKLLGTDVGIIFLLFLLFKLEQLRKGDGSFFKDLLLKLFKQFHFYMLEAIASKWPHSEFSNSVLSAVCILVNVTNSYDMDAKAKIKIKPIIGLLRNFYIEGNLKGLGKIQVLWTIESLSTRKCDDTRDEFYRQKYTATCKKWNYLLDSLENVLSDRDVSKNEGQEEINTSREEINVSKEENFPSDTTNSNDTSLNISNDSSNVFLDDDNDGKIQATRVSTPMHLKTVVKDQADCVALLQDSPNDDISDESKKVTEKIEDSSSKRCVKESVSSAELRKLIEVGLNEVPASTKQEEICETVKVPYECIERIVGYEGAILRKLEYQSQATITFDINKILEGETERPETTPLTAHRLVSAALGMPAKMEEKKLKVEHEKLAYAKEVVSRYKVSTKQHDVKITGNAEAVSTAKKLINEIVNFTTLLTVPLPGFTIDEVIDISGTKLSTIETLLNVILRLEESEDETVVLHISGDAKSCEDAKKLILAELGQVSAIQGQLMVLPGSLRKILTTRESLNCFVSKFREMSGAKIRLLTNESCWFLFFDGATDRVNKARRMMNRINTNLLFTPCETSQSDESNVDNDKTKTNTLDYVLRIMENVCQGEHSLSRQVSQDQTSAIKQFKSYSREFIVQCSKAPSSWEFPESLQSILDGDDEQSKMIIVQEGIDLRELLSLTKKDGIPGSRPFSLYRDV